MSMSPTSSKIIKFPQDADLKCPASAIRILIPSGYRLLNSRDTTEVGDFFWFSAYNRWESAMGYLPVGSEIYIRRITKKVRVMTTKRGVAATELCLVPRPPRGYQVLRAGVEIREGDKYWSDRWCRWCLSTMIGAGVGGNHYCRKK
jgi:hypothetical protein